MAITLIKNPDERNDPPRPLLEHLMALRDMLVFARASACAAFSALWAATAARSRPGPANLSAKRDGSRRIQMLRYATGWPWS